MAFLDVLAQNAPSATDVGSWLLSGGIGAAGGLGYALYRDWYTTTKTIPDMRAEHRADIAALHTTYSNARLEQETRHASERVKDASDRAKQEADHREDRRLFMEELSKQRELRHQERDMLNQHLVGLRASIESLSKECRNVYWQQYVPKKELEAHENPARSEGL